MVATAVGLAGRGLVPAVVHWAHGRIAIGFGSIGLHLATMGVGAAIGYAVGVATQGTCSHMVLCDSIPIGPGPGVVAGSMVGTVLDVVFFAHRQKLSWTAEAEPAPSWTVTPYAASKTAGLAAAGAF
jgi:hypothetical protein